jgi:hypothetical protein
MAIPNYTYLKVKMSGPLGIITTSSSFKATYTCEQANCELASTSVATKELFELQETTPQVTSSTLKTSSSASKSAKDTKDALTNDADRPKRVRTRVVFSSK